MIPRYRDTSWVNLCVTWIGEESTAFVSSPSSCNITAHRICRKEENVSVTTGTQQYCMSFMRFDFSGDEVTGNDTTCMAINFYQIEHFMTIIGLDFPFFYLAI